MDKKVIELFAGVGGFRVGLNNVTLDNEGKTHEENNFKFVWANQWEPSTKTQDAFNCYEKRFGKSSNNSNQDISLIDKSTIPNHTLLVGGFPCQDYSVARSLSHEKGIEGKKGVLWWQINDILKIKRPPFVLLENVDRLVKSPSTQRGRDFGIMLRCLDDLGYGVEWRIINAAEYGHPQRRRRIYIFGFHKSTNYYNQIRKESSQKVMTANGIFARAFPIEKNKISIAQINISNKDYIDLIDITKKFTFKFENTGLMINSIIYTFYSNAITEKAITLNQIIQHEDIPQFCYLNGTQEKFEYLKGNKRIPRISKSGNAYVYSEGSMGFPDSLDLPGRTMLTSEATVNRSTHVILDPNTNKLRTLTPIETERLNQFPDNWTNTGMTDKRRYFMMGNALVCGIINKIGKELVRIIKKED